VAGFTVFVGSCESTGLGLFQCAGGNICHGVPSGSVVTLAAFALIHENIGGSDGLDCGCTCWDSCGWKWAFLRRILSVYIAKRCQ